MVDYCKQDVILVEDVFVAFSPYIDHNTNFAVLKGKDKWACPECASEKVELSHTDTTPLGYDILNGIWFVKSPDAVRCITFLTKHIYAFT
jgi:hypothetical protein